jgi:hypothetical protein
MFEGDQSPRTQDRFDALPVVCWKSDMRGFNHSVNHNPQLVPKSRLPTAFK